MSFDPIIAKKRRTLTKLSHLELDADQKVYVILENCPLEHAKVGDDYKLLNCDDHRKFISRHGSNPDDYRPDIVHQCLLALMDSALNKAGKLQIYVRTQKNVTIEINPQCRIPRTYRRFAGLMVQLLHKFKIVASTGTDQEEKSSSAKNKVLMRVVKNPVTLYLPATAPKIALEETDENEKLMRIENLIHSKLSDDKVKKSIVFVIGGFAHGELKVDYADEVVSISQYPLSAAVVCSKVCNALEDYFDIL